MDVAGGDEDGGRRDDRGDGRPRTRIGRACFTLDAIIHYTTIKLYSISRSVFPAISFSNILQVGFKDQTRKSDANQREKVIAT